ncbi:MAG: tRNA (N(6)-L-threonylcarbamoyladenosine(37)-C(2))-methylthiotransferase MtaB [Planctomycetaceae bacterium]|jgi:threonylcarbamoyladenosine tRNA methylthiotransferase MtaB|nr:tRNA (N(6)-L-threonylcarbamoyladenosine(37)-C(2))-methylthiotransferase MtaB [Planctomycetaceae bacterium]
MFFRLFTLGCKVNQYETEYIRTGLLRLGYTESGPGHAADIVVVNTCTVTSESEMKGRKAIRKLIRENPDAEIIVMGCSAVHNSKSLLEINGVSKIISDKREIPEFLRSLGLTELPDGIQSFGERHRAYVKVQDGCRVGCSYCIIPKVRPTLQSRPENNVLEEIRTLSRNGYREIVLTGIHLGHYGMDFENSNNNLATLVRRIVAMEEPFRLRISSLEAVEVSEELIDLMLQNPQRICPHLHLSMQSGSDEVLRRMRRRWLSEPFIRRCEEIVTRFDRLALTTDIIVGFPGETEEQFAETCRVVERLQFSKIHIFRFSPRKGTEAATFSDPVPPPIQRIRAAQLAEIAKRLRTNYAASLVGTTLSVLFETVHGGTADRYLDVQFQKTLDPSTLGQIKNVQISYAHGGTLFCNENN